MKLLLKKAEFVSFCLFLLRGGGCIKIIIEKKIYIFRPCVKYTNSSVPSKFRQNQQSGSFLGPSQNTGTFTVTVEYI